MIATVYRYITTTELLHGSFNDNFDVNMNNGAEHQRGGIGRFLTETAEWNALICSIAFFLIFTAFGTVQNYATSLPGNDGAISLAILYLVLTFSNIFIPAVAGCISPRWAMFLGSATYALYVAANIHEITFVLYTAAAIMGLGAALLWVAQGSFITQCSNEYEIKYGLPKNSQLGYYNGLFWAWMVANQAAGNGLAALLFYLKIEVWIVYVVFTSINVGGVCVFLLIRPFDSDQPQQPQRNESVQSHSDYRKIEGNMAVQHNDMLNEQDMSANKEQQNGDHKNTKTTLSEIETIPFHADDSEEDNDKKGVNVLGMIKLWCTKRQLILIPFTLYSGISQAFEYGNFPAQINDDFHKFAALAIFGVVDAICSKVFGDLSDKIGRLPVLTIAFIAHGTVYVYFFLYSTWIEGDETESAKDIDKMQHDVWDFFIVAVFLGIGDAGFNTQLYALYGSLLGESSEVFANLKFWQSVSMTWGFLSSGIHENWNVVLISCFSLLVFAALPLYCSKDVRQIARPQRNELL